MLFYPFFDLFTTISLICYIFQAWHNCSTKFTNLAALFLKYENYDVYIFNCKQWLKTNIFILFQCRMQLTESYKWYFVYDHIIAERFNDKCTKSLHLCILYIKVLASGGEEIYDNCCKKKRFYYRRLYTDSIKYNIQQNSCSLKIPH